MIAVMPRPRPLYLQRHQTRHGRMVWYVRVGRGPLIRLLAEYGSEEFWSEYRAAIAGDQPSHKQRSKTGSLQWLYDRYRETSVWSQLSPATRRQRENIFLHVMAKSGTESYGDVTRADVEAGKDSRRETPSQAKNFLDAMRGLFRWAMDAGHITQDPTTAVKNPKKRKGGGFPAWTEADVAAYQARWPLGTKERVWLDVLLYTGPRRGDVIKLGRQHIRWLLDPATKQEVRVISFRTEKGGEEIEVTIPILPVLQATLDAGPCSDLAFICGENGTPLVKESFGNMFSAAARAAGIQKSAHGVRKIAATTCADNGATVHQLMAIFGWKTASMAELYTREANRRHLGMGSAHMLGRTTGEQAVLLPSNAVRPPRQIEK